MVKNARSHGCVFSDVAVTSSPFCGLSVFFSSTCRCEVHGVISHCYYSIYPSATSTGREKNHISLQTSVLLDSDILLCSKALPFTSGIGVFRLLHTGKQSEMQTYSRNSIKPEYVPTGAHILCQTIRCLGVGQ